MYATTTKKEEKKEEGLLRIARIFLLTGFLQRYASIRIDTGRTLLGRRHRGDTRNPTETGLPGLDLFLIRSTRWTLEHACSAIQSGIYYFRRGREGRCT